MPDWYELTERQLKALFSAVVSRKTSQNLSNSVVDELKQQKTTSGVTPVNTEQESKATVDMGSLKLDS